MDLRNFDDNKMDIYSNQMSNQPIFMNQQSALKEIDRGDIKPGHIIKVLQDTDLSHIGAVVDNKPNEMLYFKVMDSKYPVFSKIQDTVPIERLGNINNDKFNNLKRSLLKYYWRNHDTVKRKKILQPLLNFAFIDGVPIYDVDGEDESETLIKQNSTNDIRLGNRIKIICSTDSSLSFLGDQIVDVVDLFDKGIRVLKRGRTHPENKYYTMFYKKPHLTNQFAGIKHIEMIDEYANNHLDENIISQLGEINNRSVIDDCPEYETEIGRAHV